MDSTSLDVSGILSIQNQPSLSLKGEGTLIGIVDTGIDYTNSLFRDEFGNTRIVSIWDQTDNQEYIRLVQERIYKKIKPCLKNIFSVK